MDILPYNFRACQIGGIWTEHDRFLPLKLAYRVAILLMLLQLIVSLILHLITMEGSVDEFTDVLFLTFNFIALSLKIYNFILRRRSMVKLIEDFRRTECQPKCVEEEEILGGFSKTASKIFLFIFCLSEMSGNVVMITPILTAEANQSVESQMPFKAYQYYPIRGPVTFWTTFVTQFFSGVYGIMLDVSLDTMMYGFIIMATAQFEINCYRLENSTSSIKDCIEHHVLIRGIVKKIENFYIPVVVPLFFFSLITLCTSIFQMSQKPILSFEFWSLVSYVITMLCQVFLYCWFGNELELKSKAVLDSIFASDWTDADVKDKKSMWFIMLAAKNGSDISFHGQCNLRIETFIWIVKTAYAAMNLLQQAAEK